MMMCMLKYTMMCLTLISDDVWDCEYNDAYDDVYVGVYELCAWAHDFGSLCAIVVNVFMVCTFWVRLCVFLVVDACCLMRVCVCIMCVCVCMISVCACASVHVCVCVCVCVVYVVCMCVYDCG